MCGKGRHMEEGTYRMRCGQEGSSFASNTYLGGQLPHHRLDHNHVYNAMTQTWDIWL